MTIIFDLDGTLLNTIDDLGYACNYALEKTGYPTFPIEDYPAKVGNGINNLIRRALPESERTEENILRVRAHFVPYYNDHNCDYTRPYEGIPELLATLKAQGHHLAVASNKYQAATEKIVNHFFPGLFDVILGEREGIERKPNPQIVYDILSTLNIKHSTLYIGDSLVDYETARNAHVPFVACSWGFVPRERLVEAGIEHIVDKPSELFQLITKTLYLAGGCFWGTEHFFKQIAGVIETEVGFANGHTDRPTYEQVYTDTTGYVETVKVVYDPTQVSLEFLLRMFFVAIDPTSLNKQGHDEGTRYRTGIYYTDSADRETIDKIFAEEQTKYSQPLVVEREPLANFYPADEFHQDYLDKHPDGYCHLPKSLFDFARKANIK